MRIFIILLATVVLSACSSSNSVKGKTLNLMLKDAVKTTDPTNAYDTVSSEVVDQIYEGILQYNYFNSKIELIPNLAAELPKFSADGKTYTIKIRKDIRFQDDPCFKATAGKGRAVTADDFIYAWKRHANPANESQAFWVFDGKVAGINDFQAKFGKGKSDAEVMKEDVSGIRKIDDFTIEIKLVKPYPQLPYIMAMHFSSPIPVEAIETYGKDFVLHPVGTGPFKVKSYDPTSRIVLEKNPNYRDEFFPSVEVLKKAGPEFANLLPYAGKKLPLVDGINFRVVKEDQPRWLGFLQGEFDQIPIPKDNFSAAISNVQDNQVSPELAAKGVRVSVEPAFTFWFATVNMKHKVLGTNKYLRQAIASAIDAKQWLHLFKNDRGVIQNEINPTSVLDRCGKPYKNSFDLARAKKLMEKAGFPEGKGLETIKWDTRGTDMSERQLAEFIQKSLAAIGIKIEVVANTFPAFLEKMNKGLLELSKGGWGMDYPDAENNMQLLYGPNKSPGPNDANFDHPEFNKLYVQMAGMTSGPARQKIICRMEEIVQEEAPWAYGIFENEYRLIQKWIPAYRTTELIINKYKYIATER